MNEKEFNKKLYSEGCVTEKNGNMTDVFSELNNKQVATISNETVGIISTNFAEFGNLSNQHKEDLLNVLIEYTGTPIIERECGSKRKVLTDDAFLKEKLIKTILGNMDKITIERVEEKVTNLCEKPYSKTTEFKVKIEHLIEDE